MSHLSQPGTNRGSGRAVVADTIHRLFVEGVAARNQEANFDRTYHETS